MKTQELSRQQCDLFHAIAELASASERIAKHILALAEYARIWAPLYKTVLEPWEQEECDRMLEDPRARVGKVSEKWERIAKVLAAQEPPEGQACRTDGHPGAENSVRKNDHS